MTDITDDEMVAGYFDGFDKDSPPPSDNRSHSYRHGFANGRADREGSFAFASVADARRHAALAREKDATR